MRNFIKTIFLTGLIALSGSTAFAQVLPVLSPWTSTSTPLAGITQKVYGTSIILSGFADGCLSLVSKKLTSSGVACGSGGGGGGGTFPFSADTNFAQVVYSTSTPTLWLKSGLFASSTSQLVNENIYGTLNFPNLKSALLSVDNLGNVTASSSISNNYLQNSSIVVTTASPLGGAATVPLGGTLALTCATCNTSNASVSSITAGTGLTGGTISTSGTIALSVPVTIANGGTGTTTNSVNQLFYGGGDGVYRAVATTSLLTTSPLSVVGTLGALVGGTNVLLSCSTCDTFSYPFTSATTYATTTFSTSSPLWLKTALYASSTLANPSVIDNLISTNGTTTNATTTNLAVTSVTSALDLINSQHNISAYGGTTCTNQFVRSLSALGAATCNTVANTDLANSSISGVALGGTLAALTATNGTLTFSGSYTGTAAQTVGLNLGNANTWTGQQTFNTSAPIFGTITGSTQCLNVSTTGLVSGTGSTCGGANYWTSSGGNIYNNTGTNVGIGSSTPWAKLSVAGGSGATAPLFAVGTSSSAIATTTPFIVASSGNVGVGVNNPAAELTVQNSANSANNAFQILNNSGSSILTVDNTGDINQGGNGSAVFANAVYINYFSLGNIAAATYAIAGNTNGTFINTTSNPGSNIIIQGGNQTNSFVALQSTTNVAGAGDYVKILTGNNGAVENMRWTDNGNTGIGTTSPWAVLSIATTTTPSEPLFVISTSVSGISTSTPFIVAKNGFIGIASTSPSDSLSVGSGIASSSIAVAEYAYGTTGNNATSTTATLSPVTSNNILWPIGTSATTLTLCNFTAGQHLIVTVVNPNASAGAITWAACSGEQLYWVGNTIPVQTTTANQWDVWSFTARSNVGSTTPTQIIISGAQSANF